MSSMILLDLTEQQLGSVITLFARGYTVRHIRVHLTQLARHSGTQVPTDQDLLTLAVRYAPDIDKAREELAKDVLLRGLARKEERIRRLSEAAEVLEPRVMEGIDLKATDTYRKILSDIREEVEPLRIQIIMPDDPWQKLLNDLRGTRQGQLPNLEPTPLPSKVEESESAPPP